MVDRIDRMFPMQYGPAIPWSIAEEIYERYRVVFPTVDQSLETIAKRGGFGWGEVEYLWKRRGKAVKEDAR